MRCAKTLRMREAANVFCSVFFPPITGIVPTPAVPHKVLSFIGSGGDDIIMCVSTVLFCVLSMCSICMTFHLLAGRGLCNCFDTHFTAKWHAKLRNAKTVFTHSFERTQATGRHTGMGKMEWMLFAFRTKVVITLGCCDTKCVFVSQQPNVMTWCRKRIHSERVWFSRCHGWISDVNRIWG